jgi:hypothetical protein
MERPQGYKSNPALHVLAWMQSLRNRGCWHAPVCTARNEMETPQGYDSNPALHVKPCGFSTCFVSSPSAWRNASHKAVFSSSLKAIAYAD